MADLFDSLTSKVADSYTAKDIEVLEGLEPVRRRPGMYVGGTDERALHHLAAEALDNAMDEAVAGHATRIELELSADGWVTVRDNGRGIAVDLHRGQGMSSMKRRAKRMNGQCLVESRPGYGVVISLTVPL